MFLKKLLAFTFTSEVISLQKYLIDTFPTTVNPFHVPPLDASQVSQ